MRRLTTVLVSALLVLLFALPLAATAAPETTAADGVVLLAAEGGEGGDVGVHAPGPNSSENPNPPDDYQPPFLQNIAGGLVFALLGLVGLLGGLYYVLVQRPRAAAQQ